MMEKTLPEVCIIQYGFPFDSSKFCSAEGVPLVRIRDVVRGYSETYTTEIAGENYIVNDGDLLIGMDGEFNIAYWKGGRAYLNQRVCRLIPREDVDRDYIFYYMPQALKAIEDATPFVTVKHLSAKQLSKILIPLPDMSEQQRISAVLRSVDRVIAMRKKELDELNNLVKSRFIELFGDPERNPKKWPVVSITEIIQGKVSNGFFAKRNAYRTDGNVQVLGVANIVNRMYSNIEGLPRTNATQAEKEKYRVNYGDMLFCRSSLVAEGIGKASIVPQDTPQNVLFECHVIRLPLDLQKCVPEFVQTLSTTPYFRKQIIAQSKTATMTTIGQDGILKAAIILPPVELQQEFLRFVKQTDKSKLAVQKGLQELEILKKSLMQQYFG